VHLFIAMGVDGIVAHEIYPRTTGAFHSLLNIFSFLSLQESIVRVELAVLLKFTTPWRKMG
jgi:hypothetical protein